LYANQSRELSQEERYNLAINYSDQFIEKYPKSKYLHDAEIYKKDSKQGIARAKSILAEAMVNPRLEKKIASKKDTVKNQQTSEKDNGDKKIP
jgi:outer membrane protein assembly factor BamD